MRALLLVVAVVGCDRGNAGDCRPTADAIIASLTIDDPKDPKAVKHIVVNRCRGDH